MRAKFAVLFSIFLAVFVVTIIDAALMGVVVSAFAQEGTPGPATPAALMALITVIAQFLTSVKVSGFSSWLIQHVKESQSSALKFIQAGTWWPKIVATVAAIATASGISWEYGTGVPGDLVIHGLTLAAIGTSLWHVATTYMFQHGWFRTVFGEVAKGDAPLANARTY